MKKALKRPHRLAFRRKWWQLIILMLAFISAKGQSDGSRYSGINGYGFKYKRFGIDSIFLIPLYESPHTPFRAGALKYRQSDSSVYKWTGTQWIKIFEGSGTVNLDSLRTATQLQVVNGTDTTIFLSASESLAGAFPAADKVKVNRWEPFKDYPALRTVTNLDTSVIYTDSRQNWFRYVPTDVTSVDDTAMVIVAGSARLKRVFDDKVYPEFFGAKGDGTTNDAPAFQKMFNWLATATNNFPIGFKSKVYKINTRVTLPLTLNATQTHEFLLMEGYGTQIKTDSAISIFFRQPNDGSLTQPLSDYKLIVKGLSFYGTQTTGQKAIEFGATYGSEIVDCHFASLDTALVLRFWLKGRIANCFFTANKSVGIYCGHYSGIVGGATVPGSAFNSNIIENCRFHNLAGSFASVMMIAADAMMVRDCVSEGVKPRYNFYYDYGGITSTNVNTNTFENIWIESSTGTANTNFYIRPSQQFILKNIQRIYSDTLFEISDPGANSTIIIEDMPYMGNLPERPFHAHGELLSGSSIEFKNLGYSNNLLPLDSTKWVGGVVPQNTKADGQLAANAGYTISAINGINLQPRYLTGTASRFITVRGGILFADDNSYYIGGVSTNNRPFRINLGTGGIRVDNAGSYGFGDATATPTVTISRPATNTIGFNTASTERMRLTANGTLQIGTTATTSDITTRGLYSGRSVGFSKDSLPTIAAPTTHFLTLLDTSAAPSLGRLVKMLPSYFASQSALNDSAAAIRAAISSGGIVTQTESPVYVKAGSGGDPDTLSVRYDTATIGIRTTGVNDSALTVNTSNISTVQRLVDTAAAIRAAIGGGGGISGSGTSGRVTFWDGGSSVTSDANFLYSASNAGTLSLGTASTVGHFNIGGNRNFDGTGTGTAYGVGVRFGATTFTDNVTSTSGTTNFAGVFLESPTIAASNASITATSPMTFRVEAPNAGTNVTIGIPYAIGAFGPVWLNGAIKQALGAATHNATVSYSSPINTCDATSGAFNTILPDAATYSGFTFTFKRIDNSGNTCTVSTTSSQTIDGSTTYSLTAQYKYITVISNGTEWLVIANN